MPGHWDRLWKALPGRQRKGYGWNPPVPLILGAWSLTSEFEKNSRFKEHLKWAHEQDAVAEVLAILDDMDEADWLHHGDES